MNSIHFWPINSFTDTLILRVSTGELRMSIDKAANVFRASKVPLPWPQPSTWDTQPTVLIVNKVPSPWPHPSTQDTLQYSPLARFHYPATPQHAGHPAVLTMNKVPSHCPHPNMQDILQYPLWTRFPHSNCTPAHETPCSTYHKQGSFTLTTPQHGGDTLQHSQWTRFPHPDCRPAHGTPFSTYREHTLTAAKHVGHPSVL